eukprot:gene4327-6631_t
MASISKGPSVFFEIARYKYSSSVRVSESDLPQAPLHETAKIDFLLSSLAQPLKLTHSKSADEKIKFPEHTSLDLVFSNKVHRKKKLASVQPQTPDTSKLSIIHSENRPSKLATPSKKRNKLDRQRLCNARRRLFKQHSNTIQQDTKTSFERCDQLFSSKQCPQ